MTATLEGFTTTTVTHMTPLQARQATHELLMNHGLAAFGWKFRLDNAKRRAGCCNYREKTISLSRFQLGRRSYADSLNTITHEVAHALTQGHHHDAVWARKHRELGGDGKRCFQSDEVDDTAPWIGTCAKGKKHARYRAPKPGSTWGCKCSGPVHPLTWEKNR